MKIRQCILCLGYFNIFKKRERKRKYREDVCIDCNNSTVDVVYKRRQRNIEKGLKYGSRPNI